ncbi:hypothetical protein MAPG_03380 [Magnaporthiopsis poae ATCC 64411]|uniref:Uncharacterized protein n=1 Tax=Magnaporthiopsis poae (strain ATCC 64411 / 73-15) TaxID=644358 RepID=A0A0C4DTV3_MAGP6|nr:hypothetical protein MAPG_03380 [Magnaporthiopsis poae ATCC 64411]
MAWPCEWNCRGNEQQGESPGSMHTLSVEALIGWLREPPSQLGLNPAAKPPK